MAILSALILFTSFLLLYQKRITNLIITFAWQGVFLALVTLVEAITTQHNELYVSAGLTLILKVLFIPWLMRILINKLAIQNETDTVSYPFVSLLGGIVLVLFCYYLSNILAVAMGVMLLGMLLMITRRKAVSHVVGFMAMENGIFFAAVVATHGMPMIVEFGVAFDVLVAAIIFGLFFFDIRDSIDSLDVDRLNRLREDIE
jgi:hydrogenase-4 component E